MNRVSQKKLKPESRSLKLLQIYFKLFVKRVEMPKKAKVNLFFADHSYQIFEDEDILKEIFQYLPTLKAVNRVSKKFYKVATEMRKGKDWFWIRNEDDVSTFK